MRSTVVPAQITTVEDKIAGNLGMSQLLLLVMPIFGGSALYVALPPFFDYAVYKLVIIVGFAVLCGLLAIRVKGKILLHWVTIISGYNLRPKYYVFDKNDSHQREPEYHHHSAEPTKKADKTEKAVKEQSPKLSLAELVRMERLITNPEANLHFKTNRKGKLSVHITKV
jgi:hypothetical protein